MKNFYADLDTRLAEVPFVAGNTFSAADIAALVTVDFATKAKGVVTLSNEEHENPAPHIFSSDRNGRMPHVHCRRAKGLVRSC